MPETLSMVGIPVDLKIKNETSTARKTAVTPEMSAIMVLGKDLVHNLKSELNNINGIAKGTEIFINSF